MGYVVVRMLVIGHKLVRVRVIGHKHINWMFRSRVLH